MTVHLRVPSSGPTVLTVHFFPAFWGLQHLCPHGLARGCPAGPGNPGARLPRAHQLLLHARHLLIGWTHHPGLPPGAPQARTTGRPRPGPEVLPPANPKLCPVPGRALPLASDPPGVGASLGERKSQILLSTSSPTGSIPAAPAARGVGCTAEPRCPVTRAGRRKGAEPCGGQRALETRPRPHPPGHDSGKSCHLRPLTCGRREEQHLSSGVVPRMARNHLSTGR